MNLFTYNEKINDDYLIIDEVCKNLVFVDENIIKAKFNKKMVTLFLPKGQFLTVFGQMVKSVFFQKIAF